MICQHSAIGNQPELLDGSIDAGLYLLDVTGIGKYLTLREIAYVCGCSRGLIWWTETLAKEKLRLAMERKGYRSFEDCLKEGN